MDHQCGALNYPLSFIFGPRDGQNVPRDNLPKIDQYPGGQTLPTPKAIDFKPGALLGSLSGELGLRRYLESNGHTFVVTDKDGPQSRFERALRDADVVAHQTMAGVASRKTEEDTMVKLARIVISEFMGAAGVAQPGRKTTTDSSPRNSAGLRRGSFSGRIILPGPARPSIGPVSRRRLVRRRSTAP